MNQDALAHLPFFVYGTLIPGQPNGHLWQDGIKSVKTAVLYNAKIFDMGYYPMLVEKGGEIVRGKLITVAGEQFRKILGRLDRLEGYLPAQPQQSSFRRVKRKVVLENGERILSWTYIGQKRYVKRRRAVPDGDWVKFAAKTQRDLDNWWEAVETVLGLHDA